MTSILPIRNIKARTRALVPLQKQVFDRQNKTHRAETGPMRLGKLPFCVAVGFFRGKLVPFAAAFGGGDEASLADLVAQ